MSFYINGSKVGRLGVLSEPPTYDADITEVDMQCGRIGYARGKKVIGTGKCFEYAEYGYSRVSEVSSENGDVKYGLTITSGTGNNILILAPMSKSDTIIQTNFFLAKEGVTKIGENLTAGGNVYAYCDGENTIVYLEKISLLTTKLLYFLGKDNAI